MNWTRRWFPAVLVLAVFVSLSLALAGSAQMKSKAMKEKSLYDRLGGKKGITKVVDDFVGNCAADKRINKFFAATAADPKRLAKFKRNLVDQICDAASGGTKCKYKGKNMKEAHKGMGISGADFGALVEDLVKALDKNKVGEKEKGELLGVLGPMKSDIVEKQ